MKYLNLLHRQKIVSRIKRHPYTLLLLDYDGTLTPIVPKPQEAVLDCDTQSILRKLTQNYRIILGIITGRSLKQIKSLLGVKKIIIAASHGLELQGINLKHSYNHAQKFKGKIRQLEVSLKSLTKEFPGSIVEDKVWTLAYHYRMTDPRLRTKIKMEFFRLVSPWIKDGKIQILKIKKGWEILPPISWDKGKAVQWILARQPKKTLPIFIGDDRTDESVFRALKTKGITIRVGRKEASTANYFVKNVPDVIKFLSTLANINNNSFLPNHPNES